MLAPLSLACSGDDDARAAADASADSAVVQPPVALDPVPPIAFPAGFEDTTTLATVRLRLFIDEHGAVLLDSTRIAESSGVAALDSAAVAGAARLRYAPALREGRATATAFVQPIEFRRP